MKNIVVIGGMGYVGKSVVELFKPHKDYTTFIIDPAFHSADNIPKDKSVIDLAIVCVPTPMANDGSCDTSLIKKVIEETDYPRYLIKSAVAPGTTDLLIEETGKRIMVSPEYIGEGGYPTPYWEGIPHSTDMSKHNFQIFGGFKEDTSWLVTFFSPVLGPYCKYFQTDAKTAELVKYMENSYFATKVVFCHEFAKIAARMEVDYNELRELWLLDGRVERGCTAVFDPDHLGYGGKCLPKDISAIYRSSIDHGYQSNFLNQVMKSNELLKRHGVGYDPF